VKNLEIDLLKFIPIFYTRYCTLLSHTSSWTVIQVWPKDPPSPFIAPSPSNMASISCSGDCDGPGAVRQQPFSPGDVCTEVT